jgi:DNA-binding MurR/RpiR family transcriptional regulator
MDQELCAKISVTRPRLTPQLCRVADCLLQNGTHSCFLNVRELAAAAEVSPSAVVRFARELGYDGFQSFKNHLQHTVRVRLSESERVSKTVRSLRKSSVLERVFEQDTILIKQTLSLISREKFDRAVRDIIRAKTLYLIGEKSSFSLAHFLYYRMSRLGIRCKLLHFGGSTVFVELAGIKKGDSLLAVGFRRIPREVCKAVQLAKDRRATTITVTSEPASPLAVADVVLYADRGAEEEIQSVTAAMTLCHALIIAVAARTKQRSTRMWRDIDALESSLEEEKTADG